MVTMLHRDLMPSKTQVWRYLLKNNVNDIFIILATMISNDRTNSNPESTVGILSMAGQGLGNLNFLILFVLPSNYK